MSAARWRRAMNTGLADAPRTQPFGVASQSSAATWTQQSDAGSSTPRGLQAIFSAIKPRHLIVLALVLLLPFAVTPFLLYQVAGQALVIGLIALSLTFLATAVWCRWRK